MDIVNPRLAWFTEEMRRKFAVPKNQAKGDWREAEYWSLLMRVEQEYNELRISLAKMLDPGLEEAHENVIQECADVANCAMMLADKVVNALHKEREAGETGPVD